MTPVYRFCRLLCILVSRLFFRLRAWGLENVPLEGGVLLAANHQSYFDPPLATCLVRRQCSYLARSSLFGFGPFRWLLSALGAMPLERGQSDAAALRLAVEVLRSGRLLMLFPEGTRTRDGALGRLQPGVAAIALRAGVPVVPTFIHGAFDCWPRTRKLPRPGRVGVFYGRPIAPGAGEGGQSGGRRELARELNERIRSELEALRLRAFETMPLKGRSAPATARSGAGQDGPVSTDSPAPAEGGLRAARPGPGDGGRCVCGADGEESPERLP